MVIKPLDQPSRPVRAQAFDMVDMRGNVQVHPPTGLVSLDQSVSAHGVLFGVLVGQELGAGRFAGVVEGMRRHVILVKQFFLQIVRQVVEGLSCVGILGVSACALGWKLRRPQKRVGAPTRIERRVCVE